MSRDVGKLFDLMNEVAIIAQLARAILEKRLPDGMSQPHFGVVNHLVRLGDGITPRDLSRAFQVPKNSMTNTLAGLEKRGLIEVRPNPADARSRLVFLTDAGRRFRDQAIAALAPDLEEIARHLPIGVAEQLLPHLSAMRRTLDDNRSATPRTDPD